MMRKNEVDKFAFQRPFKPFEVRMADGHRYRFTKLEQFVVTNNAILTVDRRGDPLFLSVGMITAIAPARTPGKRRPG